jgi:hypothetical protein
MLHHDVGCLALAAELVLFEKGEDQTLKRAKPGEPFAGIADNWRVFFTANLRGAGNKLSSAFLNRVILISLEPMDSVSRRDYFMLCVSVWLCRCGWMLCLSVWEFPLGVMQGLTEFTVSSHEVGSIVEETLLAVPGSKEATAALLSFHVSAKLLLTSKQLRAPKTYTISFRTLQHAARMCKRFVFALPAG